MSETVVVKASLQINGENSGNVIFTLPELNPKAELIITRENKAMLFCCTQIQEIEYLFEAVAEYFKGRGA